MKIKKFSQINESHTRKYFSVGDLKKILESLPDDLPVGTTGHFGEFHEVDDFYKSTAIPTYGQPGWTENKQPINILYIGCPDVGDEPD
jgi:hypothetical protein